MNSIDFPVFSEYDNPISEKEREEGLGVVGGIGCRSFLSIDKGGIEMPVSNGNSIGCPSSDA